MSSDELAIVPIPALVAILLNREQQKGSPLTEKEVLAIRDGAVCMAAPRDMAAKLAERRGYEDIDPENAWEDWNAIRPTLSA